MYVLLVTQLKMQGVMSFLRSSIVSPIRSFLSPVSHTTISTMKYINNLQDLDVEIAKADGEAQISDDRLRLTLSSFSYAIDESFPKDPYSQEYYDAQMKLYSAISGKNKYTTANEHTPFDFEALKNKPFPYCTNSATTVGDQLIAQGFLIKAMSLEPGSRIVEFGPGWGNTTLHFAQMGYKVTAVDCEDDFINLIKHRAEKLSQEVELIKEDMLNFRANVKYNAAVFFECFHHCADHLKLLTNLHSLIDSEGLVAFAAEPIADFAYPWGVRLDGMSVWSIRKFGWLELGFNTSYFMRTLLLLGWTPKRHRCDASPLADVVIAKKSKMYYEPSEITLPVEECSTWAPKETDPTRKLRFTQAKSVMTCEQKINANFVEFCLSNYAPFAIDARLSAGSSTKSFLVPKHSSKCLYKVPVRDWNAQITISSKTWCPAKALRNGDNRELGLAVHYLRFVD